MTGTKEKKAVMGISIDRARLLLEDYLRQKGLPLRKAFRCLNPEHEDKHPSMSYYEQGKAVHCFSCGATYDIFDLVGMDYGLDSFRDKCEKIAELFPSSFLSRERKEAKESDPLRASVTLAPLAPQQMNEVEADANEKSHSAPILEPGSNARDAEDGIPYLLSRGISGESCRRYGLYEREGRAYFPILEGGVQTGWTARAITDGAVPRYLNSHGHMGIWNGDVLSGSFSEGKQIFVTEGVIDAILLEQMGETAISLCGSQNAGKLIKRLQTAPIPRLGYDAGNAGDAEDGVPCGAACAFIACGDPDRAGQSMNRALVKGLGELGYSCSVLALTPDDGDIGRLYLTAPERLQSLINGSISAMSNWQARDAEVVVPYSAAGVQAQSADIDNFLEMAARRFERGAVSTGIPALDKLLDGGLRAELYVIGAISSLGKTSLILQIADYISASGTDVLFFSLEQSRHELTAKSLSRVSARLDGASGGFTARQMYGGEFPRSGKRKELFDRAVAAYREESARLFVAEGFTGAGLSEIREAVAAHKAARGAAPIVVVDYLQILSPAEPRATDKQNMDRAVVELKRMSRDFETAVIAVSSFNRENYRNTVSMESFKESGAVEYSSDVLLGMQLAGTGEKDFDVNKAKLAEPRQIELVMLKNRNGAPFGKVRLQYRAKYNIFT